MGCVCTVLFTCQGIFNFFETLDVDVYFSVPQSQTNIIFVLLKLRLLSNPPPPNTPDVFSPMCKKHYVPAFMLSDLLKTNKVVVPTNGLAGD